MAEAAAAEPAAVTMSATVIHRDDMTVEAARLRSPREQEMLDNTLEGTDHGTSTRHLWPAPSTTSVMCDAKNQRIRSEADMKLLANRIQHLQLAEERARKKIAETKSRTGEIMSLKKRNLQFAEQKRRLKSEREITISALQQAVTTAKVSQRNHIRSARSLAESRRRDTSNKVKQTLAELNARHERDMTNLMDKHRTLNRMGLDMHEDQRRQKEARRAERERQCKQQYADKVDSETSRALEAQRLIHEMAEHEERLMKSLRETQSAQTRAFEDLQQTLKL